MVKSDPKISQFSLNFPWTGWIVPAPHLKSSKITQHRSKSKGTTLDQGWPGMSRALNGIQNEDNYVAKKGNIHFFIFLEYISGGFNGKIIYKSTSEGFFVAMFYYQRAGILLGGCHGSWTTKGLSGFVQKYVYHNELNKSRKHKKAILKQYWTILNHLTLGFGTYRHRRFDMIWCCSQALGWSKPAQSVPGNHPGNTVGREVPWNSPR